MRRLVLSVAVFLLCLALAALSVVVGAYAGLAPGTYWILALTAFVFVASLAGGLTVLLDGVAPVLLRRPPSGRERWAALIGSAVAAVVLWLLLFGVF